MKPLLKWAGGKRHIASQLQARFPNDWLRGRYFEPFVGGAAMFLHLQPKQALIADLNTRLVFFYRFVQKAPQDLIDEIFALQKLFDSHEELESKKYFYLKLRDDFNNSKSDSLESAALLYAINKLCFNGLYRENSKGQFNVPFGARKKFPVFNREDFLQASKLLKNTEIINADFETAIGSATHGDFVYFDPPYIPIDITSNFTSYQAEGFGQHDQVRLASTLEKLREKGIKAMCSNSDTEMTRDVFKNLHISTIQAPRMVSASAEGRGSITELVITNYQL